MRDAAIYGCFEWHKARRGGGGGVSHIGAGSTKIGGKISFFWPFMFGLYNKDPSGLERSNHEGMNQGGDVIISLLNTNPLCD